MQSSYIIEFAIYHVDNAIEDVLLFSSGKLSVSVGMGQQGGGGVKHKIGLKSVAQAAAKTATGGKSKSGQVGGPKGKRVKPSVALMKVFPNELESQQEYSSFTEWLQVRSLALFPSRGGD